MATIKTRKYAIKIQHPHSHKIRRATVNHFNFRFGQNDFYSPSIPPPQLSL